MGIYLYCMLPRQAAPPAGLPGIDGAAVQSRTVAGLACWVSFLERAPQPALERIRGHNAVVEAALGLAVTPLPVRFGQWLPSEADLEAALGERRDEHLEALRRLQGAVEYGVRVLDPAATRSPAPVDAPAPTGTAYLRQLAAREQACREITARGREIAARLRALLGSVVREERVEALPSPHGLVSVAHLVERARETEYRAGLEEVRRREAELRFLVTGPWPPYSFAA